MARPSLLAAMLGDVVGDAAGVPGPAGTAGQPDAQALARDLERLLNTRSAWPPERLARWPRVARSVYAFGFADTGADGDGAEALRRLAERLRLTLAAHEPRLGELRVSLRPGSRRAPAFTIEATLRHGGPGTRLFFDAEIAPGRQRCAVVPAAGPRL